MTGSPTPTPATAALAAPAGYWHLSARLAGRNLRLLIERRALLVNLGLLLTLALCALATLSQGTVPLSPGTVLGAITGSASAMEQFLVLELRWPRLQAGILTGAACGLAGCLMQTVARNRLATPGIIGIDNAATAFAVASVVGIGVSLAPSVMALGGAATATVLAFGLAGGAGARGYRFIIIGLGIGALAGAVTQLLLSQVAIDDANAAFPWTVGSLNTRDPQSVRVLGLGLLFALPAALLLGQRLTLLQFPDAVARSLGQNPGHLRAAGLGLSVMLAGLAVSVAGPVGMVALIAPEFARLLNRPTRIPVLSSALIGAIAMVLSDFTGRTLLSPLEVPVGIITAVAGTPYLLWILLKRPSDTLR